MSRKWIAVLAMVAAALVVACGSSASSPSFTFTPVASTSPAAASQVGPSSADSPPAASAQAANPIGLTEWTVNVASTMKAGKVNFTISNAGVVEHELLVFTSNLDPKAYPTASSGDIIEDGPGITQVSDGENIKSGGTQTRTIDLSKPGKYVFLCNIPAHFAQGMYAVVTVTQ